MTQTQTHIQRYIRFGHDRASQQGLDSGGTGVRPKRKYRMSRLLAIEMLQTKCK